MLMGRYLLAEIGIAIHQFDHQNFEQAKAIIEGKYPDYLIKAEAQISDALEPLFNGRERTLQRLSATFRRSDLVEMLKEDGRNQ